MSTAKEILVDNLRETLRQLQRYLQIGFGAALFCFLLAVIGPETVNSPTGAVSFPIPTSLALALAVSAYWVCGVVAEFFVSIANRIMTLIGDDELVLATVNYPSLLTTRPFLIRLGLTVLPPVLIVFALAIVLGEKLLSGSGLPVFGCFVLIVPYAALSCYLFKPLGEEVRRNRAEKMAKEHVGGGTCRFLKARHSLSFVGIWQGSEKSPAQYLAVLDVGSNVKELDPSTVERLRLRNLAEKLAARTKPPLPE